MCSSLWHKTVSIISKAYKTNESNKIYKWIFLLWFTGSNCSTTTSNLMSLILKSKPKVSSRNGGWSTLYVLFVLSGKTGHRVLAASATGYWILTHKFRIKLKLHFTSKGMVKNQQKKSLLVLQWHLTKLLFLFNL